MRCDCRVSAVVLEAGGVVVVGNAAEALLLVGAGAVLGGVRRDDGGAPGDGGVSIWRLAIGPEQVQTLKLLASVHQLQARRREPLATALGTSSQAVASGCNAGDQSADSGLSELHLDMHVVAYLKAASWLVRWALLPPRTTLSQSLSGLPVRFVGPCQPPGPNDDGELPKVSRLILSAEQEPPQTAQVLQTHEKR